MISRIIYNRIFFLVVAIVAISSYSHLSANAQERSSAGTVAPYLIFSTYLGGKTPCNSCSSALTFAQNAAADSKGNIYVTGATTVSDLPVLNAFQNQPAAESTMSAFVAKYSPAGKLVWCTYLGGNNQSMGIGVAAMPNGGVAVMGVTSSDANGPFPLKNAFQAANNGLSDYFVTVFDKNGKMLYSTYLGGSGVEGTPDAVFADNSNSGNGIAADSQALVYVTGTTSSGGSETTWFPVTHNAIQKKLGGSEGKPDAFLTILNPKKKGDASLVYSSFLGGSGNDNGHGITVNANGSLITAVGFTGSPDFPTTSNGYRSSPAAAGYSSNGFIVQVSSTRPGRSSSKYSLSYSTYLGGTEVTARDDTYGVTLGPGGLIVATGRTQSADFPMNLQASSIYNSAPYLGQDQSNDEPYLVKINPSLTGEASLVYSTFLGGGTTNGSGGAYCTSVAVDSKGMAYVGGETGNPDGIEYKASKTPQEAPQQVPYTTDALFTTSQGEFDAIFMQISPDGSTLQYSTFFGGQKDDRTYGLTVDSSGYPVLTGLTFSDNFPVKNPAQNWPGNTGNQNAFVSKFSRSQSK